MVQSVSIIKIVSYKKYSCVQASQTRQPQSLTAISRLTSVKITELPPSSSNKKKKAEDKL